jgi:hypothetical protein
MSDRVVLLTIPGLAAGDVPHMPNLRSMLADGDRAVLAPSCPCTPGPVRANMATGVTCGQHGIVADRLHIRERRQLESDPAWNDFLEAPTIWQILKEHEPEAHSAICFVPGSHSCGAALTCNLDRSRQALLTHPASLPTELSLPSPPPQGSDPLREASIVCRLLEMKPPDFLWCEFPQIAAAAELGGPASPLVKETQRAVDVAVRLLRSAVEDHDGSPPLWLVVSAYTISATKHVLYPNRLLLEAGLASTGAEGDPDSRSSRAWALTDRQISHVYVKDREPAIASDVVRLFAGRPGVAEVLVGEERSKYDLMHERAGDLIVVSSSDSWQSAACGTLDDSAPAIRGSHGAPATDEEQRGAIFASERGVLAGRLLLDTDICDLVLRQFGI